MNKSSESERVVYRSFEQFKAELFPESFCRAQVAPNQDVHNLALSLAEASFNNLLKSEKGRV